MAGESREPGTDLLVVSLIVLFDESTFTVDLELFVLMSRVASLACCTCILSLPINLSTKLR
jgi:hypothetical protein